MSRFPVPGALPLLLGCLSLSLWPQLASALKTDAQQPIDVQAGRGEAAMRDGRTTLGGGVEINQGTMRARSVDAIIQTKEGAISTVVLTGTPATLAQTMDDGQRLDAQALRIHYDVGAGLVVLEGSAIVTRGVIDRFEGARIEYEPETALVRADGQGSGPVTFRFQPSAKAPAAVPAPTDPATTPAPVEQQPR